MSFSDSTPVGGVAPIPVTATPATLPIALTDVTGLVPSLLAMPLPGTKVGETLRWDGSAWMAVDLQVGLPASDNAPGTTGQMHYNGAGSLYLCVATNEWIKMTDAGAGAWI